MKVIRLIDWLAHKFMNADIMNPERVNKLYRHYHRMRLWEAELAGNQGPRVCPDRKV